VEGMGSERQLVVAVEGTAALGPYWPAIAAEYVEKIVRSFCSTELSGQKLAGVPPELALVVFHTHGPYSAFIVQRSGWTKDMDAFLSWLSGISFSGGGFSEAAICEGLAEALMILQGSPGSSLNHQNRELQKHCLLVAASNPYPLPTPVYRPSVQSSDHKKSNEATKESCLADAETVAVSFAQSSVSLSVVSPKQLPTLKAIYNAGKRNPQASDPSVDHAKNPHFLVLLSESFMEARTALSHPLPGNLVPNHTITKMDTAPAATVPGPPSNATPSVNGTMMGRQPTANVKVEPTTIPPMVSAPAFSHMTPISNVASQGVSAMQTSSPSIISQETNVANEILQEHKPLVNPIQQQVRPGGPANVSILNNLSQHRHSLTAATSMGPNMGATPIQPIGAQQLVQNTALGSFGSNTSTVSGNSNIAVSSSLANIQSNMAMGQSVPSMAQGGLMAGPQSGQGGIGTNQNMINNLGTTAISSTPTMMPTPGMVQQTGVNALSANNSSAMNMPLAQHPNGQQPSKYVKIWEGYSSGHDFLLFIFQGTLSGQRQGQPVFICKLEGYRSGTASDTLASDWPETMQIVRLIAQEHMNNKQYVGKADFLVFRTLNQHGFLGQLQEKKLCAVIQLPSQTLLLSVSDKAGRLIGMLFPGDMVVFKPQVSTQQPQMQPQQQQQQLQQQQHQIQQQQQQLQQLCNSSNYNSTKCKCSLKASNFSSSSRCSKC
uniref:Mediator of RNA polymerase II transcription subunit 25 n=1 Tax=Aegilops tauschii subsp. strangulata TaxID=200361 RepID=A0A453KL98_AEGTS